VSGSSALPLLVVLSSFLTGIVIFVLREEQVRARSTLNLVGACAKLGLVAWIFAGYFDGDRYELQWAFVPGLDFVLRVDLLSLLFASLSATLWLATTIYAIGYLEQSPHRSRFFGFFSLSVTATMGIAFAGNMLTFLVFYEFLTLATYPLVVHRGTPRALAAGRTYLAYTLPGGLALLIGVVWLEVLAGPVEFTSGGALAGVPADRAQLLGIFALLVGGLGVKAALVPLHGWLPKAMVAPAPVSALLHAVAVVKAGAFGIVRVVYDLYGIEFSKSLGVLLPLSIVAAITIVYGSLRALRQDELKRLLAYSTVSQIAYIPLGVATFGPLATTGALVHIVNQGLLKITLFFCAGLVAETLGLHYVSELRGVGRRMPLTMIAFSVGALGMIGLPPLAGFVSKWYLGTGASVAETGWAVGLLALSGLLNAAYFLPIVRTAWLDSPCRGTVPRPLGREARWSLLGPALATAALALWAGLFAASEISPLELAKLITEELYAT
jgi:multicomponent Na+:H+ antiporter subunit D